MQEEARKERKGFRVSALVSRGTAFLLLICFAVFMAVGFAPKKAAAATKRKTTTVYSYKENESLYVTMKDGTKIYVRVSLPKGLKKGEKVPTVLEGTRYTVALQLTPAGEAMVKSGAIEDYVPVLTAKLLEKKYAYVMVQARGTGASFGKQNIDLSKEEIDNYGQVIDWIAKQSWSNGRVATFGLSYSSNTAEMIAGLKKPALKAAVLGYGDFVPFSTIVRPGGLSLLDDTAKAWRDGNAQIDNNSFGDAYIKGLLPADTDRDGKLLKQAVAGHKDNYDVYESITKMTYYDDIMAADYTGEDWAPVRYKKGIEDSGVPLYVIGGWQDAGTANPNLERYQTYKNNQSMVIGPWGHGGFSFFDPYIQSKVTQHELKSAEADGIIAFLNKYLKEGKATAEASEIRYYTLGEGKWKTTKTWPVAGFDTKLLYFDANGSLKEAKPMDNTGEDTYKVDFTATSGKTSRWQTNIGGGPIIYTDRAQEDKKLLTYTSEAFSTDVEITGLPVVTLNVSSTEKDGAFITYLEDVAPDGKVTYITEGELRALNRKISDKDLGYKVVGPEHTFERKDGEYLTPGEVTEMKIGMQATSVLIKKGHKVRIAIAGADNDNFDRLPETGDPTIKVQRNAARMSYVEIPMKIR